ncbi:hypothetical protein F5887DRAFT_1142921 [Amanita rubescens]|nr:hypothetical protein F5887DRAFT_1148038 [Amanita rubescens]KAF8328763.1 hypothetical protein F5887DRAFT_1142921 [Amanita rubescens]
MSDLPANYPKTTKDQFNAYARCKSLEERADSVQRDGLSLLVCARILGYLLKFAPTTEGCATFAREVNSCCDDSALIALADKYTENFVRCCDQTHQKPHPTPAPSDHPSRPSFDIAKALREELRKPPENHEAAKAQALERDRYRCALTGTIDSKSYRSNLVAVDLAKECPGSTQASHIFSPSINKDHHRGNDKQTFAVTARTIMEQFGGVKVKDEPNGNRIHRLESIITMNGDIHTHFDDLLIWLVLAVADGPPNTYIVDIWDPFFRVDILPEVTFYSNDPSLPPPDSRYLALHAACAKVTHMSDAAKHIDMFMRDMEDTKVLAADDALQLCVATA